ncbi:MAG TPA: phytanoyl-CoA dioxygenase family protein [Acidimicrobiales bacterium]|nr:phytanoyl-CoA dioxygenase family protein [Acidimicrobiales bacterium]
MRTQAGTNNRQRLVRELKVAGFTVLERVLSEERVFAVRNAFDDYFAKSLANGDPHVVHPSGANRYNVWIPLESPFLDADVVADPLVLSLLGELLDGDVVCTYYASDTALPGSEYQPVHPDVRPLFPGLAITLPPVNYVLDIPLVDFGLDNGPLEMWPQGTHLVPDNGVIPKEGARGGQEARQGLDQLFAESLGPMALTMPAGSFLIRDTRLWHRGTPNRTTEKRSMLAMVFSRSWYRPDMLPMSRSVYDSLTEPVKSLFRTAHVCDQVL